MKEETKSIHFDVPLPLYEELIRKIPGRGRVRRLFLAFARRAIELEAEQECFIERLLEDVE